MPGKLPINNDPEYDVFPHLTVADADPGYSGYQGPASEEEVAGNSELSDEWEHFSDFVPTKSSGSDWDVNEEHWSFLC